MTCSIKNRLILSLAHRPLTHDALEELIDHTASRSIQVLQELEEEKSQNSTISERRDDCNTIPSKSNVKDSKVEQQEEQQQQQQQQENHKQPPFFDNRNPTAHVLLTGSPCITQPGRTFDTWETQWTPGEQILGQYIQKVGLHHFHRIPKDGEVRLNGKLVDVKQKDFTVFECLEEQLLREFHWVADNVKQHFNLYATIPVSEAVILYPEGFVEEEEIAVQDVVDMIRRVFQNEWSHKKGPLMGARIRVETVASSLK
jgi:hypothetical protein